MFKNQKVVAILPARNAAETSCRTYEEVMAPEIVDHGIVVDDASTDQTTCLAQTLPHTLVHTHPRNLGGSAAAISDRPRYRTNVEPLGVAEP